MNRDAVIQAHATPSPARRVRRRWAWWTLGILTCVVLSCGIAVSLGLRTPKWYRVPHIDESQRQQVRNNLLSAEQAMTEFLRAGQTFVYQLHQDDLNRWLTMRREIYPLADEFTPPEWSDPFVRFDTGRITVAGRFRHESWSAVASIDLNVEFKDGDIVLTAGTVRSGMLPIPVGLFGLPLDQPIDRRAEKTWPGSPPIRGDLANGVRVGARAWWKNGGLEYEVTNVWVTPGVLKFEIQPLGSHFGQAARDQD